LNETGRADERTGMGKDLWRLKRFPLANERPAPPSL
jgi:hypothetical protein